jgi:AbrB family looped-hinge helix DNA binding protein
MTCDDMFYGSVTVGERGQIVIPAEARAELGFQPGDKLLVMRHPLHKGLMVFKIDAVHEFVGELQKGLDRVKDHEVRGDNEA